MRAHVGLTEEEESRREALAIRFVETDPWQERVLDFAATRQRVRTDEVLMQALNVPLDRLNRREKMRVANVLRRAGYVNKQARCEGKVTRYWAKPEVVDCGNGRDGRDSRDNG